VTRFLFINYKEESTIIYVLDCSMPRWMNRSTQPWATSSSWFRIPGPGQAWELTFLFASSHQWQDTPRAMQASYASVVVSASARSQTSAVTLSNCGLFGNRHPVASCRGTPNRLQTHRNSLLTPASCRLFMGAEPLLSTSTLIQCSFPGLN